MCHIGTWSTRYCMRTAEKVWRSKVKKIWFAECQKNGTRQITALPSAIRPSTRQKVFSKKLKNPSSPSASPGALGKDFF